MCHDSFNVQCRFYHKLLDFFINLYIASSVQYNHPSLNPVLYLVLVLSLSKPSPGVL